MQKNLSEQPVMPFMDFLNLNGAMDEGSKNVFEDPSVFNFEIVPDTAQ